jgi:hypothetical protein
MATATTSLAGFAPRPVCGEQERQAAVWLHDDLRARGHEAWMETHWVRPQQATSLALGCALAAIGGLVALAAPLAGLVVAGLATLSVLTDVAGVSGWLRYLRPRRATQVVLVAPLEVAMVELLITARTDVPRAGLARRLERVPGGLVWLAAAALAVTAAAGARVAGEDGTLLGALQLVPTVVLFVAAALALDAAVAPVGDGAPWDAALQSALATHEELAAAPAPGVAPGLVLAGPDALRSHLRREKADARRTALLHVAAAAPARSRHPQWRRAGAAAGVEMRGGGPGGLPAAVVPPGSAARVARGLAQVLRDDASSTK